MKLKLITTLCILCIGSCYANSYSGYSIQSGNMTHHYIRSNEPQIIYLGKDKRAESIDDTAKCVGECLGRYLFKKKDKKDWSDYYRNVGE